MPRHPPESSIRLKAVSQVKPRSIEWLWPGRLALGKLSILDGDPGLGKSMITLDLCARVSTGRPYPDGSPCSDPGSAVVLNGEDGDEDTIRPRLQSLEADLDRVFVLHREVDQAKELIYFPRQCDALCKALDKMPARLVIIDPIMAFLDQSVIAGDDQSVRRALYPLAQVAEQYQCAVLMVRHLNKQGGNQAVYRGGGSIGIVGACRSGWLIARDPLKPEQRVFAQVKNNLAAVQPSLAFTIEAREGGPATVTWLGPCSWTAGQLLAASGEKPAGVRPVDRARAFLTEILEEGPLTSRQIWPLVEERQLTRRTLRRARVALKIRTVRVWADGLRLSYWLLPDQELPEHLAAQAKEDDLEPWLGPLREKYPLPTPIDDE